MKFGAISFVGTTACEREKEKERKRERKKERKKERKECLTKKKPKWRGRRGRRGVRRRKSSRFTFAFF